MLARIRTHIATHKLYEVSNIVRDEERILGGVQIRSLDTKAIEEMSSPPTMRTRRIRSHYPQSTNRHGQYRCPEVSNR